MHLDLTLIVQDNVVHHISTKAVKYVFPVLTHLILRLCFEREQQTLGTFKKLWESIYFLWELPLIECFTLIDGSQQTLIKEHWRANDWRMFNSFLSKHRHHLKSLTLPPHWGIGHHPAEFHVYDECEDVHPGWEVIKGHQALIAFLVRYNNARSSRTRTLDISCLSAVSRRHPVGCECHLLPEFPNLLSLRISLRLPDDDFMKIVARYPSLRRVYLDAPRRVRHSSPPSNRWFHTYQFIQFQLSKQVLEQIYGSTILELVSIYIDDGTLLGGGSLHRVYITRDSATRAIDTQQITLRANDHSLSIQYAFRYLH
jgi:hypothetical protein